MTQLADLTVKIFADGADLAGMLAMAKNPLVKGFTTNPSLMRKAGIADYESFAREVIAAIPDRPISFEIFADDFATMIAQGRKIGSWGRNVNVKVPVTDTNGRFSGEVISALAREGIAVNVTAIMTLDQVRAVAEALVPATPAIVSVFAGRIADTGIDPVPHMRACVDILKSRPKAELLWASPREVLNLFQANEIGCHIITMTNDLIAKLVLHGRDLVEYSRDTVQTFYKDAAAAGYQLRLV
ncbi:MAG TPA: transaldolase [Stellaceae bacterium]|nr:transaldolase [Stellaceae bacterium]